MPSDCAQQAVILITRGAPGCDKFGFMTTLNFHSCTHGPVPIMVLIYCYTTISFVLANNYTVLLCYNEASLGPIHHTMNSWKWMSLILPYFLHQATDKLHNTRSIALNNGPIFVISVPKCVRYIWVKAAPCRQAIQCQSRVGISRMLPAGSGPIVVHHGIPSRMWSFFKRHISYSTAHENNFSKNY